MDRLNYLTVSRIKLLKSFQFNLNCSFWHTVFCSEVITDSRELLKYIFN